MRITLDELRHIPDLTIDLLEIISLAAFNIISTDVVHPSAYHEMVGMAPADIKPMRIRVQGRNS